MVSVAAIIILSIIGGLFKVCHSHPSMNTSLDNEAVCFLEFLMLIYVARQNEHHSMVGSKKDPEDPQGVAASIFAAVAVYAVRLPPVVMPDVSTSGLVELSPMRSRC